MNRGATVLASLRNAEAKYVYVYVNAVSKQYNLFAFSIIAYQKHMFIR